MPELIDTRHGPLSITRLGDAGHVLWLLPAAGRHAADFEGVRPWLAQRFRTLSLDWPGSADTPALPAPSSATPSMLAEMFEDAVALLSAEPVVALGHSLGGFCAARLAIRQPARMAGLLLVDSGGLAPLGWHERAFCALKGRRFVTRRLETAFARRHTRQRTPATDAMCARVDRARESPAYVETVAALWRRFADPESFAAPLSEIRCPVCVVWGAADPVLPLAKGRWVQRSLADAELHVLNTGHTPFAEDPDGFLASIAPFLERLQAREPGTSEAPLLTRSDRSVAGGRRRSR